MKIDPESMSPTNRAGGQAGFTLLEVILAIAVLSFGLLAVATMQVSGIRGNAFAGDVTQGVTWAGDIAEKLLQKGLQDYNDPDLLDSDGDGVSGLDHDSQADADHAETHGRYQVYWNVAEDHLLEGTKTVQVIVTWDHHGTARTVTTRSVIPEIV